MTTYKFLNILKVLMILTEKSPETIKAKKINNHPEHHKVNFHRYNNSEKNIQRTMKRRS